MKSEQLVPRGTPESRAIADRVQVVLDLTSRLNVLPFSDSVGRIALLSEIVGKPLPTDVAIHPPFYCDHGLNISLGEKVFVNQNCSFYDIGGDHRRRPHHDRSRGDAQYCGTPCVGL